MAKIPDLPKPYMRIEVTDRAFEEFRLFALQAEELMSPKMTQVG